MSAPPAETTQTVNTSMSDSIYEDPTLLSAVDQAARIDQDQYDAQQEAIAAEQSTRPLIGPLEELTVLEKEYATNSKFLNKIRLAVKSGAYPHFRRVRGDGNCFYRGYIFAILDWMSTTLRSETASEPEKQEVHAVVKIVEESLTGLLLQGYEEFTMSDFYDTFYEQFTWVLESKPTSEELVERFSDEGLGMYIVSYARYLTSGFMTAHAADYAPFIQDGRSVEEFRRTEIEPMGRESEHLQIVCLTNLLKVGVKIAYLDQSEPSISASSASSTFSSDSTQSSEDLMRTYVFPDGAEPRVHLLYRPGHYDVLSKV